jgi:hypothetical protein
MKGGEAASRCIHALMHHSITIGRCDTVLTGWGRRVKDGLDNQLDREK